MKLVIVGEDSWKKENINVDEKLKSRIVFLKNVSNEELATSIRISILFCSLDEGFGLPIVKLRALGYL